jgi:sulfite exporter TauE/SafE
MISSLAGVLAGLAHVVAGPDHLAAVAPLAVEERRSAWLPGLRWGMGHASGVITVGLFSLLLRGILPIDLLSSWSERLVGVVLIGIGLWGLQRAMTHRLHIHTHSHDGWTHEHAHYHKGEAAHSHDANADAVKHHSHGHAAFAVGALHGLAGSSHFLGVLPALAFPTNLEAVLYLAAYGAGTVAAMASFSTVVSVVSRRFACQSARAYSAVMVGVSLAALVIGGYWLVA